MQILHSYRGFLVAAPLPSYGARYRFDQIRSRVLRNESSLSGFASSGFPLS
jgi:hypothetical protein